MTARPRGGWRVSRTDPDAVETIASLLQQAADRQPDAPALIHGSHRITYRTFASRVDRRAAELFRLNLPRLGRVLILQEKSIDLAVNLFAVMKAGLIAVPRQSQTDAAPGTAHRARLRTEPVHDHTVQGRRAGAAAAVRPACADKNDRQRCRRSRPVRGSFRRRRRSRDHLLHVGIDRPTQGRGCLAP